MEEANLDDFNDHLDNYNPWSSLECCGLGSNINLNTTYLLANAVAGLFSSLILTLNVCYSVNIGKW